MFSLCVHVCLSPEVYSRWPLRHAGISDVPFLSASLYVSKRGAY